MSILGVAKRSVYDTKCRAANQRVKPMTQNTFEVPKEMRDLAEKNLEQVQTAFRQFSDALTQGMSTWTNSIPTNNMTVGFKAVQERAVLFAKQNTEAGFSLAADLAKAKDIQEVMSLQTKFAQAQMQTYAQQTQELGKTMTEAAQKAVKQG